MLVAVKFWAKSFQPQPSFGSFKKKKPKSPELSLDVLLARVSCEGIVNGLECRFESGVNMIFGAVRSGAWMSDFVFFNFL